LVSGRRAIMMTPLTRQLTENSSIVPWMPRRDMKVARYWKFDVIEAENKKNKKD
jgi:hypothetical protein